MFDEFTKFRKWGKCNCGLPEKWKSDDNIPVEYDEDFNEYSINGHVMYFCFFCGGRLPKSKRGELFTKPTRSETKHALNLVSTIKTEDDIIKVLGEPDSVSSVEDNPEMKAHAPEGFRYQYMYESRWNSLNLCVQVFADGRIERSVGGKYIGKSEQGKS